MLYKFTRSKEGGLFQINNLDTGKYVLMITHNRYADYLDTVTFQSNETKDLGNIMMTLEANLLADVTVRTRIAAMRMKGDTLEYTADSFNVQAGCNGRRFIESIAGYTG